MPSRLFSPISMGGRTLANRAVVSPMCQYSAIDGIPQAWHRQHLGSLMVGGPGAVILEATGVEAIGRITHGCLALHNDAQEAAFADLLADLRALGTGDIGIQLAHAGRKASSRRPWEGGAPLAEDEDPWPIVGPSALPFDEGHPVPAELDADGLARVKAAFVASAERAKRLGFDLVELHGAHGYLLHSFMSPLSNRRTDAYGGSLENRLRFPLEVAEAVRAVWPEDRILGMRITGTDWHEDGSTIEDAVVLAKELERLGLDYVAVSSGGGAPGIRIKVGPGYQVPLAARVKQETGLAVMAVGMIVEPNQAEAILASGEADILALARGFLDNPRWLWHAAEVLGDQAPYPPQYARAEAKLWPGAALARPREVA
ncbi:NADH:flavin oxidoreductase/NADH oxidase [Marinivivus vitaminiproducens]|uniref:NADH:flavin oxidoreductase/NADH oxidase n=1 Tax=Marinivivus vitaminiproducens TaxID=3035935 RepID=UPI00279F6B3C|nr:NADH:flavin oxidoreductase/NADH oxidase [Geminicoccaceae bacterium SCSIO 64248]